MYIFLETEIWGNVKVVITEVVYLSIKKSAIVIYRHYDITNKRNARHISDSDVIKADTVSTRHFIDKQNYSLACTEI